jgi:hypothetical protein
LNRDERFAAIVAVLCLAVWGLFGCSSEPPKTSRPGICDRVYFVSSAFPEEEYAAIDRANERWNAFGLERTCLTVGENEEHGIKRIVYASPEWHALSREFNGLHILGVHRGSKDSIGIVGVGEALSLEYFEVVALHEFGHSRALRHTAKPAIMQPAIGDVFNFQPNDLKECRRVGACAGEAPSVFVQMDDEDCALVPN